SVDRHFAAENLRMLCSRNYFDSMAMLAHSFRKILIHDCLRGFPLLESLPCLRMQEREPVSRLNVAHEFIVLARVKPAVLVTECQFLHARLFVHAESQSQQVTSQARRHLCLVITQEPSKYGELRWYRRVEGLTSHQDQDNTMKSGV